MEEIKVSSFEEFESQANALLERSENQIGMSPVLFRGHASDSWRLETTLETYSQSDFSTERYFSVMRAIRPQVESFTGHRWPLEEKYTHADGYRHPPQAQEFMAYLRHHGFPSPLLDWTRSFYVAAYFAFRPSSSSNYSEPNVAIYSYVETVCGAKAGYAGDPTIVCVGPYLRTHKRHFLQQCSYTFCTEHSSDEYHYCCHEDAIDTGREEQDVATKYIIPRSEGGKVLKRLGRMNITEHSLFGSEESLLAMLAYQEIESENGGGCHI